MSFQAPGWLGLATVAALAVVAIHFIAWRLPRTVVLPTARFVPDEPARRAARTVRLADLALLALRVALVMVAGMAMARPVFGSRPSGSATVIAVAASGIDTVSLRDSVGALPPGDQTTFVVFDTLARVETDLAALRPLQGGSASSLSVGLLAGVREARRLRQEYDTVRLVVVAPFDRHSFDNATLDVRALWPDSIRLVRIASTPQVPTGNQVVFDAPEDDPIVAGIRLAQANGLIRGDSRVVRDGSNRAPEPGQALVLWPRRGPDDSSRVDAVFASGVTAIGSYLPAPPGDSGQVIARWANGAPAAREVTRNGQCIRTIGFDVPDLGDFVLSPSFQRLAAELLALCGSRHYEAAPDLMLVALAKPPTNAPAAAQPLTDSRNRIAAVLMALAVLLGAVELFVRRGPALASVEQGA